MLDQKIRPQLGQSRPQEISQHSPDPFAFLLEENAILVDEAISLAASACTPIGLLETSRGKFKIVGTFPNASGEPIILMDISHAQRLFELSGKIDRVDLIVNDEADFRSRWKSGFRIQSGRQRQATLRDMLQAFRLNLQALSLLALFVGVFLVYNTAMFTVVSRMKDAGILRSLGASRREIVGAFLSEILLLGSIGGVLGGLAGFLLSRFLTNLVAGTISNLYFFLRPAPLEWSWSVLLISVLLGCGASVLGGIFPLIELIRADPGAGPAGPDRGSRLKRPCRESGAGRGRGFGHQPRSLQPGHDPRVFRICRLFCPFDRGQPDYGACPGLVASDS